jgi:signal transduction histidine kinase
MQVAKLLGFAGLACTVAFSSNVFAAETATAAEVMAKVKEAAKELSAAKGSEAALAEFNKKDGKYVWKDSYVFVYDCDADKMIAHPMKADLVGKPVLKITDKKGTLLFKELCDAGKKPTGGWVAYMWPKPGQEEAAQKVSYATSVEGTHYQVSAGIYDDKSTVADLTKLLK